MYQLLGQLLLTQQQYKQAEKSLSKAIALDPALAQPHFYLGVLYEQQENYTRAQKSYERALALAPTFALAANNLAWLYVERLGDVERALSLAEMAREHMSHDASVLDTLGWIYYKKNRLEQAIPLLETSVQKHPQNPTFHYHLGMAYYQSGALEAAQRTIATFLELSPHHANAQAARQIVSLLHNTEEHR
jgi:Flp pilus assembly protein TadD